MTSLNKLNEIILSFNGYVILYFTAEYCKPCKSFKPIFNSYREHPNDNIYFDEIDMGSNDGVEIGIEYKISKIPLLRIYKNAQLVDEYSGTDKGKFKSLLDNYVLQQK